ENLGVLQLFKLSSGSLKAPEGTEKRTHTPLNPSKKEVTRACVEAHRTLMEANPENVGRFKEVTQFLAEDLKHLKAKVCVRKRVGSHCFSSIRSEVPFFEQVGWNLFQKAGGELPFGTATPGNGPN